MTTLDIRAMSQLACLMARPKMYTPRGTLQEVLSFLEGYRVALQREHRRDEQADPSTPIAELADLDVWLHETAGLSQASYVSPADLATALARTFRDETAFFSACRAFLENRTT